MSPALGNLTFLRKIYLSNNGFHGRIPPELGHLSRLQHLSLGSNSLRGHIPRSLSRCSRLVNITMGSNKLHGELPGELGCLSSLTYLDLSNNSLSGSIPAAMGNLSSLTILDLSNNTLSGGLPAEMIANLSSSLRVLELASNRLSGSIPATIGNLSSLYYLDLSRNAMSGEIPPILGRMLSLEYLHLAHNTLTGGIPPLLGELSALRQLGLSFNNLSGDIPSSLWNLSSLQSLLLRVNSLSGSLPSDIGIALPRLQFLSLAECKLHGSIPVSLANSSQLAYIQLNSNMLTGIIPPNLGGLQSLIWLDLYENQLEAKNEEDWSFLTALTNCTNLGVLELDTNNLGGIVPNSVANLSTGLRWVTLAKNHISGNLPPDIGNLVGLTIFEASSNLLRGSIPDSVGMLQRLQYFTLSANSFSGEIPSTLGNLTLLNELHLDDNNMTGAISSNIGSCQKLTLLNLRNNDLTGAIPREIFFISDLSRSLDLSRNSLTGSIPSEVGNLKNLGILDFSGNKLSGQVPTSLEKCQLLEALAMGENFLQGPIPSSFSALRGIRRLDLSHNNLSGSIPSFLKDFLGLYYLNLSFNDFEGEMPRGGAFDNASAISVLGNNNLCGGNPELQLQRCRFHETRKKHTSSVVIIICITSSVLFSIVLFCFLVVRYLIRNSRRKSLATVEMERQHVKVSYAELVRVTNGFSTSNLIGAGSFGSVYKGMLDENIVAVKVLNLQQRGASRSFIAECEALRNIRHRNLVKILTSCSSVDFQGNDFKAMVFEFMSNGNLDSWLHPEGSLQMITRKLNFLQRLNIAIDVASALDYLHHHGDMPIVHCDLKPSNILLDDDMTAHVSDFGLSKFLMETISKSFSQSISSIGLKGTIGYVAPEYGVANRVSTSGDVYSCGILLLEMFTGKKPTDEIFREGRSLREFVEMALPEQVMQITDTRLLLDEEDREADDDVQSVDDTRTLDCIASLLRIGLACSNELATERMEMGTVTGELQKLKETFLNTGINSHQQRFDRDR